MVCVPIGRSSGLPSSPGATLSCDHDWTAAKPALTHTIFISKHCYLITHYEELISTATTDCLILMTPAQSPPPPPAFVACLRVRCVLRVRLPACFTNPPRVTSHVVLWQGGRYPRLDRHHLEQLASGVGVVVVAAATVCGDWNEHSTATAVTAATAMLDRRGDGRSGSSLGSDGSRLPPLLLQSPSCTAAAPFVCIDNRGL